MRAAAHSSLGRIDGDHAAFAAALAKASLRADRTGLLAEDLLGVFREHRRREEQAHHIIESAHAAGAQAAHEAPLQVDHASVDAALAALEGFAHEHTALRAKAYHLHEVAVADGNEAVAVACVHFASHMALEDSVLHKLAMAKARALLSAGGRAPGPGVAAARAP